MSPPSFPPVAEFRSSFGDHILPSLNTVSESVIPCPRAVASDIANPSISVTSPHPVAILQSSAPPFAPHPYFVFDPDFSLPNRPSIAIYLGVFFLHHLASLSPILSVLFLSALSVSRNFLHATLALLLSLPPFLLPNHRLTLPMLYKLVVRSTLLLPSSTIF